MFIEVKYDYSNELNKIKYILENLPDLIAFDFEAANKCSKGEIKKLSELSYNILTDNIYQQINATGLSHPELTTITHLAVAWSKEDAFVVICDTEEIKNYVCNFLVTTDRHQLWHNCLYDFKFLLHSTNKLPINYEDTRLLAKCVDNNASSLFGKTGLKDLMGKFYGKWAEAKEADFVLEDMYDKTLIKYAATDACATYHLFEWIKKYFKWK